MTMSQKSQAFEEIYRPVYPIGVGDLLKDMCKARSIPISEFAKSLSMTKKEIRKLFRNRLYIDSNTAHIIGITLGISDDLLISMQDSYQTDKILFRANNNIFQRLIKTVKYR